jgi:hypothetical protein
MKIIYFILIFVGSISLSAFIQSKIENSKLNRLIRKILSSLIGIAGLIAIAFSFGTLFINKPDPNKIPMRAIPEDSYHYEDLSSDALDHEEEPHCYGGNVCE